MTFPLLTIAENTYRKQTRIDGEDVVIDILDTAGQEEYCVRFISGRIKCLHLQILKDQYINSGEGFVCVYSITDNLSFDSIRGIFANITKVKQKDEPKVFPYTPLFYYYYYQCYYGCYGCC